MAAPIVLWNPKLSIIREADDAGVRIAKTTLPSVQSSTPRYRAYEPTQTKRFTRVPGLASFCIRALSQYPEQLHQLGATRLHFHPGKDGSDSVLRSVLPKWRTPDFSLLDVDPRLWATVIQIYRNPPDILSSYPCRVSDPHVPLLNQIPCTPDFSLITVLDLTDSNNITDSNILSLKVLHNLSALNVSGCHFLSARGIEALSRTLAFDEFGEKRGPWMLRILRMRSCAGVDKTIFNSIHSFPLLTVLDLRGTKCQKQDVKRPFFSAEDSIFDIPIVDAIRRLSEQHRSTFPSDNPYILSLEERPRPVTMDLSLRARFFPEAKTIPSRHNNFVVLPASQGSTRPSGRQNDRMQFGNTDASEFLERELARERRRFGGTWYFEESDGESIDCECWEEYVCDACRREGSVLLESIDDSDDDRHDSDIEILYALRGSIASRNEGRRAVMSSEVVSSVTADVRTGQREASSTAASVDTFYRLRRPLPAAPAPRTDRGCVYGTYDLALLRSPPAWHILESLTADGTHREKTSSSVKCGQREATMAVKRRQLGEASMKLLHRELSKRRRVSSPVNGLSQERTYSPPPSPTLTVCDVEDRRARRELLLQPISNLQPPPRPSLLGRPRLKLEAAVKTRERSPPSAPVRFTAVAKRRNDKSRTMSLAEGFKLQSQRLSLAELTGDLITPSSSKHSGDEPKLGRSPDPKHPDGKRRRVDTKGKVNGFDWGRWRGQKKKK